MEERIGSYEVVRELARGGMGVVYEARDPNLGRPVAIKVLQRPDSALSRDRFWLEAQATARLRHPNIVAVHQIGETEDERPFIVMDFVKGEDLEDRLASSGPLPPREAAEVVATIAEAVHAAHQQLILHRDLKPANVLIDERGRPLLTDFGLAKQVESDAPAGPTITGAIIGTPAFMPPEQASGNALADFRSDVYGLGATLYALLTGAPPFVGDELIEVLMQVARADPQPPNLVADVPRDLETICLKCLEKEPGRRYPSAKAVSDDLKRFLADEPIEARPPGRAEKIRRWVRQNRRLTAVVSGAATLLLLVGVVAGASVLRADQRARATLAADSRDAATAAWARWEGAASLDTGVRLGHALAALQAAQAWRVHEPDAAEAKAAQSKAARALGQLAQADAQWSLAREAFALAEPELGPEAVAGLQAGVEEARTRETRRRVQRVESWLERAASGALLEVPEGLTDAVFAIVQYPGPETTRAVIARLDRIGQQLLEVEFAVVREGATPTPEERAAGERTLDVEAGIALRRKPRVEEQLTDEALVRPYAAALRRVCTRVALSLPKALRSTAPGGRVIIGRRQTTALGPEGRALIEVCCRALGRLGGAAARDALSRYLLIEHESSRALFAARALARAGGLPNLSWVLKRFGGHNSAFGQALAAFLRGRKQAAGGRGNPLVRAAGLQRRGELEEALAICERVLKVTPDAVDALELRASIRLSQLRPREALQDINRVLALSPGSPQRRLNRAKALLMLGQYRSALENVRAVMKEVPHDPVAWTLRGSLLSSLDQPKEALKCFRRALQLDPGIANTWSELARARDRAGDLEGALLDHARAIQTDPTASRPVIARARTLSRLKRYEEALADLARAEALEPRFHIPPQDRGQILLRLKRYDEAARAFERATTLNELSFRAWQGLGDTRALLRQDPEALAAYDRALRLEPRHAQALLNRAVVRARSGDRAGARADYQALLPLLKDPKQRATIEARIKTLGG